MFLKSHKYLYPSEIDLFHLKLMGLQHSLDQCWPVSESQQVQPEHSSVDEDRKKNETKTTSKEMLYNATLWQKRYEIRDEESGTQRHREREIP